MHAAMSALGQKRTFHGAKCLTYLNAVPCSRKLNFFLKGVG